MITKELRSIEEARELLGTSRNCADRATAVHLRRRYPSLHCDRHHDRVTRGGTVRIARRGIVQMRLGQKAPILARSRGHFLER